MRDLELLAACEELKLERLVKWLMQILERPADVCEVAALPPDVYVHMARKLLVTFEGPPTPSCFSPRASFNLGHRSSTGPLASFLPARTQFGDRSEAGAEEARDMAAVARRRGSATGKRRARKGVCGAQDPHC